MDMKSTARSVAPRSRGKLASAVATEFEARILSGELAIGARLPSEAEIARVYGISTRSVREAVQILETKGLVRRRHGELTTVVRDDVSKFLDTLASAVRQLSFTDPDYLMKLMVVRRMIETEVVGILTSSTGSMNAEVGKALQGMHRARDVGDFAGFIESDAAFHSALVRSAGNEILTLFYDNLYGLIADVIRVTSRVPSKSLETAYAEHAAIYSKIQSRDEAGAKALLRAQIDNSAEYLRIALQKGGQSKIA